MAKLSVLFFLALTQLALADQSELPPYYPESFLKSELKNEELKSSLHLILDKAHIEQANTRDLLADNCLPILSLKSKSIHRPFYCSKQSQISAKISYTKARQILFGKLHLGQDQNGFFVQDLYCQNIIGQDKGAGPNQIPNSKYVNCEHTWPQSRFSRAFSLDVQKVDLHHLYPVDSRANSSRNNRPFLVVENGNTIHESCHSSLSGKAENPQTGELISAFFPPSSHRGNIARALFYFSIRYKLPISSFEEQTLRNWHNEDPIDEEEKQRNEEIYKIQKSRNPFIDRPEFVAEINDF